MEPQSAATSEPTAEQPTLTDSERRLSPQAAAAGGLPGARLRRVTDYIEEHVAHALPVRELGAVVHMSRFHFSRLFKQSTGLSPHRFVVQRRVDRACALLAAGEMPIAAIARTVGFRTATHFATVFRRVTGCPPTVYRTAMAARRHRAYDGAAPTSDVAS
jgi:AraC family transcriptional regulator